MALITLLQSQILENLTANSLEGVSTQVFANAIALSIGTWARVPSNIILKGITAGSAGVGTVNGKLTVQSSTVSYETAFTSHGLVGLHKTPLSLALSKAVAISFSASKYRGTSQGVGMGTDVSKIVFVNKSALVSILNSIFASNNIKGINAPVLALAISTGVQQQLLQGIGKGVVVGSASSSPSVGSSNSKMVI